ncbi:phosphatidylinositol mannoside acyltransferase [Cellulomonas marina]|uniref:KDO2-lipid IV(A) lauroyltransferase n=1 Tax=Cellulomonas marina TaxID=988821 RepID=A0A1I0W6N6_9CELL|nr:phosphatidylinositol mannoside acyltransferase [Cellulomonas marina]GIG30519.1 lipid A biosynthesis lauroyl acyltransferase [Cellulomonas marina]SFA83930.1 KDO2-lipid IV(A) lauroyltransferase [Cellulomonas marina]
MSRPRLPVGRAFALAWRWAGRVPGPVLRGVCALVADVTWLRHGAGVRRLEANLARVRPDLDGPAVRRLSRRGMRSYLRYYGEAFAVAAWPADVLAARVRAEGREHLQRHLDAGRSPVLALGHMGNWDLAGAWATTHLAPVTTVAERLEPEEVFTEFLRFREGLGMQILPLTGGEDVFRGLVRAVRSPGRVVPLLADRDLTARGVEVRLAGRPARVAAGPAALALGTGAPLHAVVLHYERLHGARRRAARSPWGLVVRFSPELPVPTGMPRAAAVAVLTQTWVDVLEAGVREHPEDWHMLQRVFVEDLDPARDAAVRATTVPTPAPTTAVGP